MRGYLEEFTRRYGYSEKARDELCDAYRSIAQAPIAYSLLTKSLSVCESAIIARREWMRIEGELTLAGEHVRLPRETVCLLFCILLTPTLHRLYIEGGYPDALYDGAVLDLKWKSIECEKMNGFTGISCFDWMYRWYSLERFALGRLQYQRERANRVILTDRVLLERGDPYLNMRIPSSGPLTREAVVDSYGMAKEFFSSRLEGRPVVIQCTSWLLFPRHRELLPPSSNIRRFSEDFALYDWGESAEGEELWRIFYKNAKNPPDQLPRRTTLERVYADLLMRGERPGWGSGVLLANDVKA